MLPSNSCLLQDYAEKVQTVIHELSHFESIADTNDYINGQAAYGEETCYQLAQSNPAGVQTIADSFGYYAMSVCTLARVQC